jgi:hypothetical protein
MPYIETLGNMLTPFSGRVNPLLGSTGGTITTAGGYRVHTFSYTGADQTFTPSGSGIIETFIWGAGGGCFLNGGNFRGGGGGYTTGNVTVSNASALTVVVGAGGDSIGPSGGTTTLRYGGGGQLTSLGWGGQGGGLSGLFTGPSQVFNVNTPQSGAQARSILIAGGGGASGDVGWGGVGGGTSGGNTFTDGGGSLTSYGAGLQTDSNNGFDGATQKGSALKGGNASGGDEGGGGGGGAGYFGGGGGSGANGVPNSGGGGSGFISGNATNSVTSASTTAATNRTPPQTGNAYYTGTVGFGALQTNNNAGNGLVIVRYAI